MSYDLYFWPSGAASDPQRLCDRVSEDDAADLRPDARVLAFRTELLRRWPDLADRISPGRPDLADRFVILTLPYSWEARDALPVVAGTFGLDCYDPQIERLLSTNLRTLDDVPQLAGWIGEEHVVRFLRQLSAYIGYRYDDLDEAALVGALDDTDDESDAWFEYPLQGTPALLVRLAQPPGGSVVSVEVVGPLDLVLAARVETLLDVY